MSSELLLMLWNSLLETITMVGISGLLGAAIGIPVGILLYTTTPTGIHPMPVANRLIGWVVNAIRSTPFIILLVAIIPFTRIVAGTSIGTTAAIVPLTIAAAPFIARLVETSLREVDKGLIEAAQSMGATNLRKRFPASSRGSQSLWSLWSGPLPWQAPSAGAVWATWVSATAISALCLT